MARSKKKRKHPNRTAKSNPIAVAMRKRHPRAAPMAHRGAKRPGDAKNSWRKEWE